MNKKLIIITVIIVAILITLAFGAISIYIANPNDFDNKNPIMKESMIKCTLEWGRLDTFPNSKTNFIIKTEGSPFTRAFRASFYLSKEELEKWIKASPGLQDAEITSIENTKKRYNIKPGGNAQFAQVTIDYSSDQVEIYTYWS